MVQSFWDGSINKNDRIPMKKTKAETVESLVDSRLQATQCEDSAHPPSHGKNRGVVSKTQDSQSPPSEEMILDEQSTQSRFGAQAMTGK
uniref:Uncharacterized protein n=1 Tax=Haemonchus contortus TaxID=6289 RepID=W6NVC8_HAECO